MHLFYVIVAVAAATVCGASISRFPALDHIKPSSSATVQEDAVRGLIQRIIGSRADEFDVIIKPDMGPTDRDMFILESLGGKIVITGSSGIAASWAFYYYLKTFCGCHISWGGDQLDLPDTLPQVPTEGIIKISNDRFRYYQNVCTVSYSFVWWNWTRWEQEIDWMAMNGINLPLAFNAQEAIWQRVYLGLGLNQSDLDTHFSGPAFFAWARMGNMHGWGGPLPQSWHTNQVALQHKILQRMRDLGMIPVVPGFAGHVPKGITRVFPKVQVSFLDRWGRFPDQYCCTALLNLTDPLFKEIGKRFIQEYTREFGTDHVYNADTFNEMIPASLDPSYIASAGKAVYEGMVAGDPKAIWLMQGWLFVTTSIWKIPQAEALLTSVPQGRMIVLDLYSELRPQYNRLSSYFGQPFIWCMLHDFGGTVQMYGALENVNKGPFIGRTFPNSSMIGTGLTPEGINQNDVVYEFMNEHLWRNSPRDIKAWIADYAVRRYGKYNKYVDKAWQLLAGSIYNYTDQRWIHTPHHSKPMIVRRPSLHPKTDQGLYNCTDGYSDGSRDVIITSRPYFLKSQNRGIYNCTDGYEDFEGDVIIIARPGLGHGQNRGLYNCTDGYSDGSGDVIIIRRPGFSKSQNVWYEPEDLFQAWDNFLLAAKDFSNSSLFKYDLVDVTRQSLEVIAISFYDEMTQAYQAKNLEQMLVAAGNLLNLLSGMDDVLATDVHFLLGNWIESAKALATNEQERQLYEYNARNQITLWGPTGQILDYANKQWSGLVADYYRRRWEVFILALKDSLTTKTSFNASAFNKRVFDEVEEPFTFSRSVYPDYPVGNSVLESQQLYDKFRPYTLKKREYFGNLQKLSKQMSKMSPKVQHMDSGRNM